MMPAVPFGSMQEWQHGSWMLLSFCPEIMCQLRRNPMQMQCLNQRDLCKCCNTIEEATSSISTIEKADSNGDLSKMAKMSSRTLIDKVMFHFSRKETSFVQSPKQVQNSVLLKDFHTVWAVKGYYYIGLPANSEVHAKVSSHNR
jgi:hypothetical protein